MHNVYLYLVCYVLKVVECIPWTRLPFY